tara:strand:+ start:191 stop:364 length:174 start_codon:yes stop_codon:yes gene_type:complete
MNKEQLKQVGECAARLGAGATPSELVAEGYAAACVNDAERNNRVDCFMGQLGDWARI